MSSPGGSKAAAPRAPRAAPSADGPARRVRGAARAQHAALADKVFSVVLANSVARAALAGILEVKLLTLRSVDYAEIDMADRNAVRLVSRHWRREFDAGVTKIRFCDDELSEVAAWRRLARMQWPRLKHAVFFSVDPVPHLPAGLRLEFPVLEYLDASFRNSLDVLAILRRCHLPALQKLKVNLKDTKLHFPLEFLCSLELPRQVDLEIGGHGGLTAECAALLAATRWPLARLTLDTTGESITADAVAVLGTAPWASSLSALCMPRCDFGAAHAKQLLALPALREINLSYNRTLGPAAVAEICRGRWPLRRLELVACGLTASALEAIVAAPWATGLEVLAIGQNLYPGGALLALQWCAWPNLHSLDVGGCDLAGAGVAALAGCRFPALTTLNLTRTGVGSFADDIRCLVGLTKLSKLKLNLNEHGISPDFFKALCATPFPHLAHLNLRFSRLNMPPAAAGELLCRAAWPLNKELNLARCFHSLEGLAQLEAALCARWPAAKVRMVRGPPHPFEAQFL